MIISYKYFNNIDSIYVSEKTKRLEKFDIIVMKVNRESNKKNIKDSIMNIFNIKVKKVNTLIVKKKLKKFKNKTGYIKSYKKAYIFLEKGKYINYLNKLEKING